MYPPLAPIDDLWVFDLTTMYPEYLSDLRILVSYKDPDREELVVELQAMKESGEIDWDRVHRIAAKRYVYFPWAVTNTTDFSALVEAREGMSDTEYDSDLELGDERFYRLREGIERFLVTGDGSVSTGESGATEGTVFIPEAGDADAVDGSEELFLDPGLSARVQSDVMVLMETDVTWEFRGYDGSNTLYMDGHVEFRDGSDESAWINDVMAAFYPDGVPTVEAR